MLIGKRWTEQLMTVEQLSTNTESKLCKDNKNYSFWSKVNSLVDKLIVKNCDNNKKIDISKRRCRIFDDMW
jgi:hypothetical protein